jgi:Na+-transporting methylmalonyl-CoA/oxaloacetate decarboxylase gamma subunit
MPKRISLIEGVWNDVRFITIMILTDTVVFLLLLGVLAAVYFIVGRIPYPENRKEILDTLHYYAYVVITVMFLCDLIYGLGSFLLRKAKKGIPMPEVAEIPALFTSAEPRSREGV